MAFFQIQSVMYFILITYIFDFKKEIENFNKRLISNATKHPSHLRRRFLAKLNELWEEADPELHAKRFDEDDENFLSFSRQARMQIAFMTKVYAKYEKAVI